MSTCLTFVLKFSVSFLLHCYSGVCVFLHEKRQHGNKYASQIRKFKGSSFVDLSRDRTFCSNALNSCKMYHLIVMPQHSSTCGPLGVPPQEGWKVKCEMSPHKIILRAEADELRELGTTTFEVSPKTLEGRTIKLSSVMNRYKFEI